MLEISAEEKNAFYKDVQDQGFWYEGLLQFLPSVFLIVELEVILSTKTMPKL